MIYTDFYQNRCTSKRFSVLQTKNATFTCHSVNRHKELRFFAFNVQYSIIYNISYAIDKYILFLKWIQTAFFLRQYCKHFLPFMDFEVRKTNKRANIILKDKSGQFAMVFSFVLTMRFFFASTSLIN